jgi:hypothetical protein
MPKELHIILSDEDHKALLEKKDGLTWREVLFKILEPREAPAKTIPA